MTPEQNRDPKGKYARHDGSPLGPSMGVRLPEELYEIVKDMPNRAEWMREAIIEKAIAEGIWEKL